MDQVMDVVKIVQREVAAYADVNTYKGETYYVEDDHQGYYLVLVVPDLPRPFPTRAVVMARIESDRVIIEEDTTDRPLFEALMRSGIPREKIVLAYAGESLSSESAS
jgi:XisI protein